MRIAMMAAALAVTGAAAEATTFAYYYRDGAAFLSFKIDYDALPSNTFTLSIDREEANSGTFTAGLDTFPILFPNDRSQPIFELQAPVPVDLTLVIVGTGIQSATGTVGNLTLGTLTDFLFLPATGETIAVDKGFFSQNIVVPVPASAAGMGLALMALFGLRRRR